MKQKKEEVQQKGKLQVLLAADHFKNPNFMMRIIKIFDKMKQICF